MEEKQQAAVHVWPLPEAREKNASAQQATTQPGSMAFRERIPRRFFTITLLALAIWCITRTLSTTYNISKPRHSLFTTHELPLNGAGHASNKNATLVPLEAHIMSKCPDAQACLQKLVVPTMERIHDKIDFRLSVIGSVDPDSDAVSCMHGPSECLGNTIILCAAKLYPDPKLHLGFANCMISDYKNIPQRELVEGCTMEHGLDFKELNACISDEGEGEGLLRSSAERSADNNVTKSCTVRLNGEIRCIRDGGEWYDCPGGSSIRDLVSDVGKLYDKLNSQS